MAKPASTVTKNGLRQEWAHTELSDVERRRINELTKAKVGELDEIVRGKRIPVRDGTSERFGKAFYGFDKPVEVMEAVLDGIRGFEDVGLAADFVDHMSSSFLPDLAARARRHSIRDVPKRIKTLATYCQQVPERNRSMAWVNIGLPLMSVTASKPEEYGKVLETIESVPRGKKYDWIRSQMYGEKAGEGLFKMLDEMPQFERPQQVSTGLADIIDNISNPKRRAFIDVNGPELMRRLSVLPTGQRDIVWNCLLDADSRAHDRLGTKQGEFLRLEGKNIIGPRNIRHHRFEETLAKAADEEIERRRAIRESNVQVTHEPRVITSGKELGEGDLEVLRREVAAGNGNVDVIVHPLTAERWIDSGTGDFYPSVAKKTGRSVEDFETYKRHLTNLLRTGDRLKVIFCDPSMYDRTMQWVSDVGPERSVLLVKTQPSGMDGSATPLSDDVRTYAEGFNRVKDDGVLEINTTPLIKGDTYAPMAEFLQKLGTTNLRFCGEYAVARTVDGVPQLDSDGNMNLSGGCVAGSRKNLTPYFDTSVLDDACYPSSTALPPSQAYTSEDNMFHEEILETLPPRYKQKAAAALGNAFWAIHSLKEMEDNAENAVHGTKTRYRQSMRRIWHAIENFAQEPRQNINQVAARALILARDVEDPLERVERVDESLGYLSRIGDVAPGFAVDPLTSRAINECTGISRLNDILRTANMRAGDVQSVFKDLTPRVGSIVSRLLSPPRTNERDFFEELGRFRRIISATESPEFSIEHNREDVVVSYLVYLEEQRALRRTGFLKGTVVYPEIGSDITSLGPLRNVPTILPEKPEGVMDVRDRLVAFTAMESEMRTARTVCALMGYENPDEMVGTDANAMPVTRNVDNMLIVGSKIGGSAHLNQRLSRGSELDQPIGATIGHSLWRLETRNIVTNNLDLVQGQSSDVTPLVEHMAGATPHVFLMKGPEVWVYTAHKKRPLAQDSDHIPYLYDGMNRMTTIMSPGTKVLVSEGDPTIARYFRENDAFREVEIPASVRLVQQDYPDASLSPIKVTAHRDQGNIGDVELSGESNTNILYLLPKGKFRIFERRGEMPQQSLAESANRDVVLSRGSERYVEMVDEAKARTRKGNELHSPRRKADEGAPRQETLHVFEEEAKTQVMFEALVEKHRSSGGSLRDAQAQAMKEVRQGLENGEAEATARGLERHPRMYVRYRNLASRTDEQYAPIPELRKSELEGLGYQIAVQAVIEEAYHEGRIPPSDQDWSCDIKPHAHGPIQKEVKDIPEIDTSQPNPHKSMRAAMYARLGLPFTDDD